MSAPGEYRHGDSGWSYLYSEWDGRGRPGQFEIAGEAGGSRFRVHNRDDTYPSFLLISGAGPTSTGYVEAADKYRNAEWPGPRSGYEYESRDTGLDVGVGSREGSVSIAMVGPPKDMATTEELIEELEG
jgi:hypothetical protein